MTLRYASLAAPAIRVAYEEAMNKARTRLTLPITPAGQPIIPGRVEWLRTEMLKTRVAHGYCSRQLAAEACPYANICEQCDNYVTAAEFTPQLQAQLADITALRDDAAERGWHTEVARHSRVITSIQNHLQRLTLAAETDTTPDSAPESRLIEIFFSVIQKKVVTPNDFASLGELSATLLGFVARYNQTARPFSWKFTAADLHDLMHRISRHQQQDLQHEPQSQAA
jgi:hypothetical protein